MFVTRARIRSRFAKQREESRAVSSGELCKGIGERFEGSEWTVKGYEKIEMEGAVIDDAVVGVGPDSDGLRYQLVLQSYDIALYIGGSE